MTRAWPFRTRGRIAALVAIVLIVAGLVAWRWPRHPSALASVTTETVQRRDITVTVEATGTVEPINLVEVKSKASGQITRMPVEIGSRVNAGDLLVQVDPRDVQNSFDQAQASVVAAEARATVARDQRKRADELFQQQVITAPEHESALLEDANARSSLVGAKTNLDLARQRLEDATVRAPIAGTILDKPVSVGQVISSATSSVSGGTTLLQMADLSRIRMRAQVAETDIGKVHENQNVSVIVDAYPQRTFHGTVEKIEPQATVQQSVTMFPVLISISNEENLLLPGMNGEVTMMVDERANALSVSLDAIKTMKEFMALGGSLGISTDSLRAQMRSGSANGGMAVAAAVPDSARARRWAARGDSAGHRPWGGGAPDSATMRRMREGGGPGAGGALDPERAARWRQRMAERGQAGGGAGGAAFGGAGGGASRRAGAGMGAGTGGSGGFGGRASGGGNGSRVQVAVVKTAEGLKPRIVRIGLTNYDYAEVLGGLEEGEEVVQLGVLEMQSQRNQMVSRVRQGAGAGLVGGSTPSGGQRAGGGR